MCICWNASSIADPELPPILLETILQSEIPADIFGANVSGLANTPDLLTALHDLLATQLEVIVHIEPAWGELRLTHSLCV